MSIQTSFHLKEIHTTNTLWMFLATNYGLWEKLECKKPQTNCHFNPNLDTSCLKYELFGSLVSYPSISKLPLSGPWRGWGMVFGGGSYSPSIRAVWRSLIYHTANTDNHTVTFTTTVCILQLFWTVETPHRQTAFNLKRQKALSRGEIEIMGSTTDAIIWGSQ